MILAAGEGRRLMPLTADVPKVMLPLAGRPLLELLVRWCRLHGVTDVHVNLFHAKERILEHFSDGAAFGVRMHYLHIPALRPPLEDVRIFASTFNEPFYVLYGDVATTLDLSALADSHTETSARATVVVRKTDHPEDSDLARIGPNAEVQGFIRKGSWKREADVYGNAGCYVLDPDFVRDAPVIPGADFIDGLFEPALASGRVFGYVTDAWMLDIGTPERYARAVREFVAPPGLLDSRVWRHL